MAMPRELEILSTRIFDHIEQRPECPLLADTVAKVVLRP
jgi:hypothetical protein